MLPTSCKKECTLTHSRGCGGRFPVKQKKTVVRCKCQQQSFWIHINY